MRHGNYNTSHLHHNRTQTRPPRPRTHPRFRLQLSRLQPTALPAPPPPSPPPSRLPVLALLLRLMNDIPNLSSEIWNTERQCIYCYCSFVFTQESGEQPHCSCPCHGMINSFDEIERKRTLLIASVDVDVEVDIDVDDIVDDDEDDDDEYDDEDDDQVKITREIIREYLLRRDCYVIKSEKEEEEEEEEEEEGGGGNICMVCLNEMGEKEIFKWLDCGHDFHEKCITKWLLCKNSCPICVSVVIPPDFTTTQWNSA